MWHEAQSVGVPANLPLIWHCWHDTLTWNPVSGNLVSVLWSNFAPAQPVVLWQVAQVVGKPAVLWFGFAVRSEERRVGEAQSFGVPASLPLIWHCWQGMLSWSAV